MPDWTETPVVTVFLHHRGEVLLLRRSEDVDSYPGQWGAVAGHVEDDDPDASALAEIEEETHLSESDVSLVRRGASFPVEDADRETRWIVHPYLFETRTRTVTTNWETAEAEWVAPTAILERDVVPELWTSYRRVAPSVVTIADDTTHGSATLSLWALEVLRDRAGRLAATDHMNAEQARARLVDTATELLDARPSMAALRNRVHRVMNACHPDGSAPSVAATAHDAIGDALQADTDTATHAADTIAGQHVLTLSRSGTVLQALRRADPSPSVVVAASQPAGEGIGVAEALANDGLDVTLIPDAAVAATVADGVDALLVGADTVLPSGAVVNKTGTRAAALAAAHADVPFYVACSTDKISTTDTVHTEEGPARDVYDGRADLAVRNPTFDLTPTDLITGGLITERGVLATDDVPAVADDLAALANWLDA
jgi:translation initiation factor 2B subunit (eIF-2B alpha/beta/delta family)